MLSRGVTVKFIKCSKVNIKNVPGRCADGGVWYFIPDGELIVFIANGLHRPDVLKTVPDGADLVP